MKTPLALLLPLALAACASWHVVPPEPSPCDLGEATWECQIGRYHNVNVE